MSDPRALFQGFVRESWVEDLDFTTLERVNESFTSDGMEQRHADMVWRLRSKSEGKGWFYVFFLLEFQSTSDPFMAVRLLTYVSLLYSGPMRANAVTAKEGLPAVFSVVLYNGKRPWRAGFAGAATQDRQADAGTSRNTRPSVLAAFTSPRRRASRTRSSLSVSSRVR